MALISSARYLTSCAIFPAKIKLEFLGKDMTGRSAMSFRILSVKLAGPEDARLLRLVNLIGEK